MVTLQDCRSLFIIFPRVMCSEVRFLTNGSLCINFTKPGNEPTCKQIATTVGVEMQEVSESKTTLVIAKT